MQHRPPRATGVQIRLAVRADLAAIDAIYNHYVLTSTCTYQESVDPPEARQLWFDRRGPEHPVTVATMDDEVVGWAALSAFHRRSAYRFTVENALYVRPDAHGRGIGSALLADLIHRAAALGHRSIIALIDAEQPVSLALHARHGFTHAGRLAQAGFKFNRWLDVIYMQRIL